MSELTDSKMDFDTLVAADWLPSAKLSGELNAGQIDCSFH